MCKPSVWRSPQKLSGELDSNSGTLKACSDWHESTAIRSAVADLPQDHIPGVPGVRAETWRGEGKRSFAVPAPPDIPGGAQGSHHLSEKDRALFRKLSKWVGNLLALAGFVGNLSVAASFKSHRLFFDTAIFAPDKRLWCPSVSI